MSSALLAASAPHTQLTGQNTHGMGFKNVSTIIEGRLYLGNLVAAASTRAQTERRITHILSVCLESIPAQAPQSGIVHMRIPVEDKNHSDLLIWLPHACRFIDDALRAGGIILVYEFIF